MLLPSPFSACRLRESSAVLLFCGNIPGRVPPFSIRRVAPRQRREGFRSNDPPRSWPHSIIPSGVDRAAVAVRLLTRPWQLRQLDCAGRGGPFECQMALPCSKDSKRLGIKQAVAVVCQM